MNRGRRKCKDAVVMIGKWSDNARILLVCYNLLGTRKTAQVFGRTGGSLVSKRLELTFIQVVICVFYHIEVNSFHKKGRELI